MLSYVFFLCGDIGARSSDIVLDTQSARYANRQCEWMWVNVCVAAPLLLSEISNFRAPHWYDHVIYIYIHVVIQFKISRFPFELIIYRYTRLSNTCLKKCYFWWAERKQRHNCHSKLWCALFTTKWTNSCSDSSHVALRQFFFSVCPSVWCLYSFACHSMVLAIFVVVSLFVLFSISILAQFFRQCYRSTPIII